LLQSKAAWTSRKLASDQSKAAWTSRKLASDQSKAAWTSRKLASDQSEAKSYLIVYFYVLRPEVNTFEVGN